MKKLHLFLLFISVSQFVAFAQFREDFTSSGVGLGSAWQGDRLNFVAGDSCLSTNAKVAGSSLLYRTSKEGLSASYYLDVELNFNPSSSNYLEIALASVDTLMENSLSLCIGKTSDKVQVIRNEGLQKSTIYESEKDLLNQNSNRLKIKLEIKDKDINIDYSINDSIKVDTSFNSLIEPLNSRFFILKPTYTITRKDKFSFYKIYVDHEKIIDSIAPKLHKIKFVDDTNLSLKFNEKILPFAINQIKLNPQSEIKEITTLDSINFDIRTERIKSGKFYSISLEEIEDVSNNKSNIISDSILYYKAKKYDLRVNEINYDPDPESKSPFEFLELYNSSGLYIDLDSLFIKIDGKDFNIPGRYFHPNSFLTISNYENIDSLSNNLFYLNFNRLNNNGAEISIYSKSNQKIDQIDYSSLIEEKNSIDGENWSLELINPYYQCSQLNNWNYCINPNKNTLNSTNSISDFLFEDTTKTRLRECILNFHESYLLLKFDNKIGIDNVKVDTNYNGNYILTKSENSLNQDNIEILLEITDSNSYYYFKLRNLTNCKGDLFEVDTVLFVNTEKPTEGDILINELMFKTSNPDEKYIELYNNSSKFINLNELLLSNFNFKSDAFAVENPIRVSEISKIFKPKDYFTISEAPRKVFSNFQTGKLTNYTKTEKLPKLNSTEGNIAVLSLDQRAIDYITYSDDMHFALISDDEKIDRSLERISSLSPSMSWNNWTSASSVSNFSNSVGSPSSKNSQALNLNKTSTFAQINRVFNPKNQNEANYTAIEMNFNSPNTIVNARIFDKYGTFVKQIHSNELIGEFFTLIWDGTSNSGDLSPQGIYIISIETNNDLGEKNSKLFTCRLFY